MANEPWLDFQDSDSGATTGSNTMPWEDFANSTDNVPPQKTSGLISRIGEDLNKRDSKIKESYNNEVSGKYTGTENGMSALGQIMGGMGDIVGDVIGSSARGYGDLAHTIAPETSEAIADKAIQAANYVGSTKVGKVGKELLGEGAEKVSDFAKNNPRLAYDIDSGANILSNLPLVKGGQVALKEAGEVGGLGLEKAGAALTKSGNASEALINKNAALEFIQPKQTSKVLENASKRQGVDFETGKAAFTPKDEDIANTVLQTPGVDLKKNNIQDNLSALVKGYNDEAQALKPKLAGVTVPVQDFQKGLSDIKNNILNAEGIDETERNARLTAVDKMMEITNRKSGNLTGADILEARQKLDKTFLTPGGDLKAAAEKIYKDGIKPIRDYTNDFLAANAPNAGVLDSLQKQHHLKTAIDNVATKVPAEVREAEKSPKGLLGKAAQYSKSLMGLGGGAVFLNEMAEIYPALAQHLAPVAPLLGAGYVLTKGGKKTLDIAVAPATRQKLGAAASKAGKFIRK